jgi:hypothetical protein
VASDAGPAIARKPAEPLTDDTFDAPHDATVARTPADSASAPASDAPGGALDEPAAPTGATVARTPAEAPPSEPPPAPAPSGPVKVARKVAPAAPQRPAVRRVARSAEPPIIPVEPVAEAPAPAAVVSEAPAAAEPAEAAPARRGLFRRLADAFRGGGDEPPSPDAEPVDESAPEPGETGADGGTLSRSVAQPDRPLLSRSATSASVTPALAGGTATPALSRAATATGPAGVAQASPEQPAAEAAPALARTARPMVSRAPAPEEDDAASEAEAPVDEPPLSDSEDAILETGDAEATADFETAGFDAPMSGDAPSEPMLSRSSTQAPAPVRAGRETTARRSVSRSAIGRSTAPIGAAARALARKEATQPQHSERPHLSLVTPEQTPQQPHVARSLAAERLAASTGGSLEQGEGGLSTVHFPPPAQPGLSTFEPYTISREITDAPSAPATTTTTSQNGTGDAASGGGEEKKGEMDPETLYEYFLDRFKRDLLIEREQLGHLIIDNP